MDLLKDLCRLCAEKLDHSLSKDIFAPEHCHLLDTIMRCIQSDVSNNDRYPKLACYMCVWKLNILFEMRDNWASAVEVFNGILAEADQSNPVTDNNIVTEIKEEYFTLELELDDDRNFECEQCDQRFHNEGDLTKHMKTHIGIQRTSAPSTGASSQKFKSGACLFECEECGKSIKRQHMPAHRRTHTKEKPFICTYCNKAFSEKGNLTRHTFIHTGVKRFKCNDCEKGFMDRSDFLRHTLTHLNAKPSKCEICEIAFDDPSRLSDHINLVHGKKRKWCHCGKGFENQARFAAHVRTHTGEKPYTCGECGRGFAEQGNLNRHRRIHDDEKRFHCHDCGIKISDRSDFTRHCLIHAEKKANGSISS